MSEHPLQQLFDEDPTINMFGVGSTAQQIVVSFPKREMAPKEAIYLAAWLVVMAESVNAYVENPDVPSFDEAYAKITGQDDE